MRGHVFVGQGYRRKRGCLSQILTYLSLASWRIWSPLLKFLITCLALLQPAHEKIGVVDSQWIVHQVIPSLGSQVRHQ